MKIHCYIRYHTQFGESLHISINNAPTHALEYLNDDLWEGHFDVDAKKIKRLYWQYSLLAKDSTIITEVETDRQIDLSDCNPKQLQLIDQWNPIGALENVFLTKPFQLNQLNAPPIKLASPTSNFLFKVKAPLLQPDEQVCLLGHGNTLRNWDTSAPLLLQKEGVWWRISLDLSAEHFPLSYKYGVWNSRTKRFLAFEDGTNRTIMAHSAAQSGISGLAHDGFIRIPYNTWHGAGISIPVFSLRSKNSWGIGEFSDIPLLADWAKSVGMKMIQVLPINDTTSSHTWMDSYPYAPVSVFALHPIYMNVVQLAGKKYASIIKPHLKTQIRLNTLETIDYEAVIKLKWKIIRQLFDLQKSAWLEDSAWLEYYCANKHWLDSYAVFCWLRDLNGTPNFNHWTKYSKYDDAAVKKLVQPDNKSYDQIALHLFVQWHLHLQLKAAVDHAHRLGVALKGDLPIGIYRHSADAWVAPELYNMDTQAGAPPDSFAEKGQNWGFPTYNWARMKTDGFAWWRQRFEQMSHYFDAFRIDHILGFFRIWSIPSDAVEGILGQFLPAIPITENELREQGIGFRYNRLCKPFINQQILADTFRDNAGWVAQHCLMPRSDGHFDLLPTFDSQRKVEAYFEALEPGENQESIKQGLFDLIANVILIGKPAAKGKTWEGAFRFDMEKTTSFQHLPDEIKAALKALYIDYFYRRQDSFWEKEALDKLPALKRSTNMLICGEDLGLVPACVPGVMRTLGLLSLEIQRMPKAQGAAFLHPKNAPYLSVITPGTHDMSVLRSWWEEDRRLSQRYYNVILGQSGPAPYLCEPWIVREIITQHFHAPTMWAIFQLQDLLGMDESLRRENPAEERINIPANPKHHWHYRMHISLEALLKAEAFNQEIRMLVQASGRA